MRVSWFKPAQFDCVAVLLLQVRLSSSVVESAWIFHLWHPPCLHHQVKHLHPLPVCSRICAAALRHRGARQCRVKARNRWDQLYIRIFQKCIIITYMSELFKIRNVPGLIFRADAFMSKLCLKETKMSGPSCGPCGAPRPPCPWTHTLIYQELQIQTSDWSKCHLHDRRSRNKSRARGRKGAVHFFWCRNFTFIWKQYCCARHRFPFHLITV